MKRVAATQRAAREGLQRRRSTVAAKDRGSSSKAHRPHAGGTRRERESRRAAKRADSLPRLGALLDAQREPIDGYPLRNSGTPRTLPGGGGRLFRPVGKAVEMECMRAFREEWGSCVENGFKDFDKAKKDALWKEWSKRVDEYYDRKVKSGLLSAGGEACAQQC